MATPHFVETFYVFVSCPNDLARERAAVRTFFESMFNPSIGELLNLRFEVLDWERMAHIDVGDPQDLITSQLLERYGKSLVLGIGILGQRFGTETPTYNSGTEAEFEWLAARRREHGYPEVKWFFRRIAAFTAPPKKEEIREAQKQWQRVQKFRARYRGLYREFGDPNEFIEALSQDLFRWFGAWIEKKRAPLHSDAPPTATVPDFLDNRIARTLRIIAALEEVNRAGPGHIPCIRICAATSSLAIARSSGFTPEESEYLGLLEQERNLLERLVEKGAELKVLLTWNAVEMVESQHRNPEDVLTRLDRLRDFCARVAGNDGVLPRIQMVHASVRERNVLILGERYLFEGRKLSIKAGFEATTVVANHERILQEIQMFDILFDNAIRGTLGDQTEDTVAARNRQLIATVLQRIDRDRAKLRDGRVTKAEQ